MIKIQDETGTHSLDLTTFQSYLITRDPLNPGFEILDLTYDLENIQQVCNMLLTFVGAQR